MWLLYAIFTKQNFQIYLVVTGPKPGGSVGLEEAPSQMKVHYFVMKGPPFEIKGPLFKTKGLLLYITTP